LQSLKLRNLMGKILRISLKLNFSPNTLGGYGLNDSHCLKYTVFLHSICKPFQPNLALPLKEIQITALV